MFSWIKEQANLLPPPGYQNQNCNLKLSCSNNGWIGAEPCPSLVTIGHFDEGTGVQSLANCGNDSIGNNCELERLDSWPNEYLPETRQWLG
jgi:hypothetical protein